LDLTVAQWRADLRLLAQELPKRHANAFHSCSKSDFDAAVADLDSRLHDLNSDESWAGMERIACMIGDAHTYIRLPVDCPDLPLVIGHYGDEYRVARVSPGMEKALGAKVLAIGSTPVAKARELLRPLSPREIFENRADVVAAIDFTAGCVLHAVGINRDRTSASYTLQSDAGERFTVEAKAGSGAPPVQWIWPFTELPLFRREPGRSFSLVYLREAKAVYANVRAIRNLREPGQELRSAIDERRPDKLIVDLRQNAGGDYFEGLNHLIKPIAANPALNRKGHLFVLIGPLTFSAAMANAAQFRSMTAATLVGEMIGVRPNEYSEPRNLTLPNSRLTLRYSTRFYRFVDWGENVIKPDVEVPTSWADYRTGLDPVLDSVLKGVPSVQ
jgi:hypothetical protein